MMVDQSCAMLQMQGLIMKVGHGGEHQKWVFIVPLWGIGPVSSNQHFRLPHRPLKIMLKTIGNSLMDKAFAHRGNGWV